MCRAFVGDGKSCFGLGHILIFSLIYFLVNRVWNAIIDDCIMVVPESFEVRFPPMLGQKGGRGSCCLVHLFLYTVREQLLGGYWAML